MATEKVEVIIVTYSQEARLRACLDSVVAQTFVPQRVTVIDNSGQPQRLSRLRTDFTQVYFICNAENVFYGAALNQGIRQSSADFILCLNDDVCLHPDFIHCALAGFRHDPSIGMVSGKVLRSDKRLIDSTGLFLTYARRVCERGYGHIERGQFASNGYCFGVTGAVAFLRKTMLEAIQVNAAYFDERMRMFYEDADLCWRAQHAGWRGYYIASAEAYHARGASVRLGESIGKSYARHFLNDAMCVELIKNRLLMISKNETSLGRLMHCPGVSIYTILNIAYLGIFRRSCIKMLVRALKIAAT